MPFSQDFGGVRIDILESECSERIKDEYARYQLAFGRHDLSRDQFVTIIARGIEDLRERGHRPVSTAQILSGKLLLELCLRLWLHVYALFSIEQAYSLKWNEDQSIESNLKPVFQKCQSVPTSDFPLQFTVANLLRYRGFKLQATSMINGYLILESEGNKRILYIYTGIGWLTYLGEVGSPLPSGLIEKVLDSFAPLFPPHGKEPRKHLKFLGITNYYNSNKDLTHLIRQRRKRRQLNRIRYVYLHDRLSGILDIFNGPTTHCK